jgi:hypothetical protein
MTIRRLVAVTLVSTTLLPTAAAGAQDREAGPDVVLQWNQLLQANVPGTAAIMAARYYAMVHVAMFDAANSAEPSFGAYRLRIRRAQGASAAAAAAQAAHDVAVALIPTAQAAFDAALAAQLATIPPGRAALGVVIGREVAADMLAWRADDGWLAAEPGFSLPAFPGLWQVTPGATVATFTRAPGIKPFAVMSATQFLPPPPPTLTSARYTTDFNEVKEIGSASSPTRTSDQTLVARLWAGVASVTRTNLFQTWNNVARDAAVSNDLRLVATARLFALVNVAIHDGLLTTQTSKFVYGLWRPVTAIRRADEDLNLLTSPDPLWSPLITTPSYPAYAGNMACTGASAATVLARVVGTNDMPVTIQWRLPDDSGVAATRQYAGFWEAAQEQERSRVWGGIHYSFDGQTSQIICPQVASFALDNYALPQ